MSQIDPALGDYIPVETFASMVGTTRRTISRWMAQPDGLPHLHLGRQTYVPTEQARDWIASRVNRRPPVRRRGAR